MQQLKSFLLALALMPMFIPNAAEAEKISGGPADRAYSVSVLTRIAGPVLNTLAEEKLHAQFPVHEWEQNRSNYTRLEAFGRTFAGIAPWLELGPDDSPEGRQRARFIELTRRSLVHANDPASKDFVNFTNGRQPLVDASLVALGLLRAPQQIWSRLDAAQRANVITALKQTRKIKPSESNWLLFSATIEAALWQFTGECEMQPIEHAVRRHQEWYVGDGTYSDGAEWHWDYYNSYVIQPLLLEVIRVCAEKKHPLAQHEPAIRLRARRYAAVQERMISPEGTFPVIGRSSAYRFGAFHHLATMALRRELPDGVEPAAVRCALTAVVRRMIEAPGTFDEHGWLRVGSVGHQPSIREHYVATGSLYWCLSGLTHLGLPANDPFWSAPPKPWTQKRIWAGEDIAADHAMKSTR